MINYKCLIIDMVHHDHCTFKKPKKSLFFKKEKHPVLVTQLNPPRRV